MQLNVSLQKRPKYSFGRIRSPLNVNNKVELGSGIFVISKVGIKTAVGLRFPLRLFTEKLKLVPARALYVCGVCNTLSALERLEYRITVLLVFSIIASSIPGDATAALAIVPLVTNWLLSLATRFVPQHLKNCR